MNKPALPVNPNGDLDNDGDNNSLNIHFDSVLETRLSRRGVLRGGLTGMTGMMLSSASVFGLAACGGSDSSTPEVVTPPVTPAAPKFNFNAIAKSLEDKVTVPTGFSTQVLFALGDPINQATPAYKNDGTDGGFEFRAGDHHDGMNYFGLNALTGTRDASSSTRGLLVQNHENITQVFLHANGGTNNTKGAGARPVAEVDKEIAAHGVSIIEVQKINGKWQINRDSGLNRRITANTPTIELSGPARGSELVRTRFSPTGQLTRGTVNNCATGDTPWGTFLTCEENWAGYFARATGDNAKRTANQLVSMVRNGLPEGTEGGSGNSLRWPTAGSEDRYARWNISQTGTSPDGSDDFRNEANTFGYVVEIDPYNPSAAVKKRTAMGRFAHECAVYAKPVAGKPLAFYMGDDARNEYIYKYVSTALWDPADANRGIAAGDKYLDAGTLYVAKFNDDGSGTWLPLTLANTNITNYAPYRFTSLAEICVDTRIAADAAGATKMDRPEWCTVNPKNGEVYYTLTNNSNRVLANPTGSQLLPSAANPRAYEDSKGTATQRGNVNGHIIRTFDTNGDPAATSFKWDVYLFAAEATANANINLSGLTTDNDMSSPDGLWFGADGLLWIQTDDGAYTDVTNCMMLAALPGQIGDGGATKVSNVIGATTLEVSTQKGKNPTADTLRRFLVGPKGCELTGMAQTPDYKTFFCNIQHPGEDTSSANLGDPSKFQSHWPQGGTARPQSATIVITKDDGGKVGLV